MTRKEVYDWMFRSLTNGDNEAQIVNKLGFF